MKPKYKIGDRIWVVEADYNREIDTYKPDFVTIEKIEEVVKNNRYLFGRKLKVGIFIYKMEEGCSYWRAEDTIFLGESDALEVALHSNQTLKKKVSLNEEFESLLKTGIAISDGIYDVTSIEFKAVDRNIKSGIEWIRNHEKFWVADAYETDFPILLSDEPRCLNSKKWNKENWVGSGFNYGSTNIIKNCPKGILILAEND